MISRFALLAFLALAGASGALAQNVVISAGPTVSGHAVVYVGSGTSQPVVQDAGNAGGGGPGIGLSELGLALRGTGTPPYASQGHGPDGENFCNYDAPTTNATGYHYFCLSPNALGGGLVSYGAGGGAAQLPLQFLVNGQTYSFPLSGGGSTFGDLFPTSGTAAGFINSASGNMVGATVDNSTGGLNVNIVGGSGGAATSANQTGGGQKTQIVDGSGNVIASTSNNLNVQCANCSGSGASAADEAAFTAGASLFAPTGGFYQTTATSNPLTNGQQGFAQMTANRAIFENLRNASGAEIGVAAAPLQVSLANTAANGTAVKVDGTGGSFPVSGTLAVTQSTSPWVATGSGTAGSAAAGVLSVHGIASMTPVQVSQATAANLNATVNVAQINGVTPLMGNGVTGTGSPRVTIASDNTANSNPWLVTSIPSSASGASIAPVVSSAVEANHVIKGSAGNLYGFSITTGASNGYVFVFNATSAPADGAISPVKCYQIPAQSSIGVSFSPIPLALSTGITISFSTTGCFTKTASATAYISAQAE